MGEGKGGCYYLFMFVCYLFIYLLLGIDLFCTSPTRKRVGF